MNSRDAIKLSIDTGDMICMMYLGDLTDAELMRRPCDGCNHLNWQIGHLIASEHKMVSGCGYPMPPLPAGFDAAYTKETSASDDASKFMSKAQLLEAYKTQRAATLAALAKTSDAELDKNTGVDYMPTVGAMFSLQGAHWLMHAGQWAVVRRQLGRPPLF